MSRITLISSFDKDNEAKINATLVHIKEKLCRIPFIEGLNRMFTQDLPFHFTIYSWDENEIDDVIYFLTNSDFNQFFVNVTGVDIMKGRNNSFVLYFKLDVDGELLRIQRLLNLRFHNSKFSFPYNFHITILISDDFDFVLKVNDKIESVFVPFSLNVSKLSLYKIYPASKIQDFIIS